MRFSENSICFQLACCMFGLFGIKSVINGRNLHDLNMCSSACSSLARFQMEIFVSSLVLRGKCSQLTENFTAETEISS